MIYKDLLKPNAYAVINALHELHSEVPTWILSEDIALYQLGFVEHVPVTLEIDITSQTAREIWDEVIFMECCPRAAGRKVLRQQ